MLHNEEKVKTKIDTAAEAIITTSASPFHHASGEGGKLVIQEPPMTMASTAAHLKAAQKKKSEKIPATVIDVAELGISDFGWNEDNIKLDFITGRKNCAFLRMILQYLHPE